MVNGIKSFQCRGRVSRPAASNRLYKGVAAFPKTTVQYCTPTGDSSEVSTWLTLPRDVYVTK